MMLNVGILVFNGVGLLDFAGPYEVFTVTSKLNDKQFFNTFTISRDGKEIQTVDGLKIVPDYSFENHPSVDILIIPGGEGAKVEMNELQILQWIRRNYEQSQVTASVCSGALILGKIGLLDDLESITHHEDIDELQEIAPQTTINRQNRFVSYGKVMTSAGSSAGIDLALYIVKKFCGAEIGNKTIVYLEYGQWQNIAVGN